MSATMAMKVAVSESDITAARPLKFTLWGKFISGLALQASTDTMRAVGEELLRGVNYASLCSWIFHFNIV